MRNGRRCAAIRPANGKYAGRRGAFAALAACVVLAGCASDPLATFDLTAPRSGLSPRKVVASIVVSAPEALAPLDSDRIMVRSSGASVGLLKGAQWSDRLPQLFRSRLIQTFENGSSIRAVARPGDRISADYNLVSEIRRFEIDAGTGQAVVEISAKMVREGGGSIAAGRIFEARTPVASVGDGEAVAALDVAMGRVLRDIAGWAASVR